VGTSFAASFTKDKTRSLLSGAGKSECIVCYLIVKIDPNRVYHREIWRSSKLVTVGHETTFNQPKQFGNKHQNHVQWNLDIHNQGRQEAKNPGRPLLTIDHHLTNQVKEGFREEQAHLS